ncbi:amino acid ABC transporter substrate-binding protein [Desulfovibrio sp. XJ01]|nr:amino acid ABC transporter substrate-binding protein [Nitratidesulfovibrio liaohensis]
MRRAMSVRTTHHIISRVRRVWRVWRDLCALCMACAVVSCAALLACGVRPALAGDPSPRTLVAVSDEWAPRIMAGPDGSAEGICSMVLRQVAEDLGLDVAFGFMPKPRRQAAFRRGEINVVPCASPMWEGVLADVAVYSEPFMMATEMVVVPAGTKGVFRSVRDFAGMRVGTIGGYVYHDGFDEAFEAGMLRREDAYAVTQNLQKLRVGRIDAMIVDDYEAAYWMHKAGWSESDFRVAYVFADPAPITVMLHASLRDFLPQVNASLARMRANGTLRALFAEYGPQKLAAHLTR